jgi:outer membrane biosynthesis protein TonB
MDRPQRRIGLRVAITAVAMLVAGTAAAETAGEGPGGNGGVDMDGVTRFFGGIVRSIGDHVGPPEVPGVPQSEPQPQPQPQLQPQPQRLPEPHAEATVTAPAATPVVEAVPKAAVVPAASPEPEDEAVPMPLAGAAAGCTPPEGVHVAATATLAEARRLSPCFLP